MTSCGVVLLLLVETMKNNFYTATTAKKSLGCCQAPKKGGPILFRSPFLLTFLAKQKSDKIKDSSYRRNDSMWREAQRKILAPTVPARMNPFGRATPE
jgi:hypothetical protein